MTTRATGGSSPAHTLHDDPSGTELPPVAPSSRSASTHVGTEDGQINEKKGSPQDEQVNEKSGESSKDYQEIGMVEIEEYGVSRQVKVVLEQKSGKEVLKEMTGGPYTQPRW